MMQIVMVRRRVRARVLPPAPTCGNGSTTPQTAAELHSAGDSAMYDSSRIFDANIRE